MISWYTNDGISPATDHNSELPHVKAITPESQPGVEVSMLSFAWRNVTGLLIYIYIYICIYVYIYIYHIDTCWYILIHIMLFSYLFIYYMHIIYKYNYTYIYIFKYVQMISQQSKVYSMDLFLFPYIYTVYIYMCLYTEHRNSWLLWMFIPKNMVWLVLNHTYIYTVISW